MSSKASAKSKRAAGRGRGRAMSSEHDEQVGRSVSVPPQLSSPPIKLRRTGAAANKPGKQQAPPSARRQLFQASAPTTSTATNESGATTSTTAVGSMPTATFYGRGQTKAMHMVPSAHPFAQPKMEVLAMQQQQEAYHVSTTTSTASSLAVVSEPEFPATSSHLEEGGTSSMLPGEEQSVEPELLDDPDFLASAYGGVSDSSGSPSPHSPLLFSPENSPSPPVPLSSPNLEQAKSSTRPPATIPTMFRPLPPAPATAPPPQEERQTTAEVAKTRSASNMASYRSGVWQHFQKVGLGQKAKCNHCSREVSRGKDVGHLSNSGMNQHMRVHHQAVLLREQSGMAPQTSTQRGTVSATATATISASTTTKSKAQKDAVVPHPSTSQPTLEDFGGFQSKGMSRTQGRKITRLIGQLIAVGGAPFNMVEGEPFKQLMQAVAPQYRVPSRKTFSRSVVPALYRACVGVLKEEIGRAGGQSVHLTTDLWSTCSAQHAFLSLTAHWWQPKVSDVPSSGSSSAGAKQGHRSFLLHAEVLDERHTSQNILQALQKMLLQWFEHAGQKYKIGYIVTDGGSNMTKAVRDGRFVGVRCSAHILHQVVTDSLKVVEGSSGSFGRLSKVIESCRKMAGHFHRSVRDSHLLREEQRKAGLPEHCLKQDVGTRWNSTLAMLERILEQQKALHAMACDHYIGIERPLGREDWVIIGQVVAVLKPFLAVTELLSCEDASLGQVLPLLSHLQNTLERFKTAEEPLPGGPQPEVLALVSTFIKELDRRTQELISACPELMLAAICDPRIKGKMAVLCSALTTWRDRLIDRVRERERQTGRVLGEEEEEEDDTEQPPAHPSTGVSSAPASAGASSFWAEALKRIMGTTSSTVPRKKPTSAQEMVRAYLSAPAMDHTTDPMIFWQQKSEEWPALADFAKEVLSCPPTTVQSERVFSVTGNILSPQRSQMSPQLMEQLAFLKINMPKLGYPSLTLDID